MRVPIQSGKTNRQAGAGQGASHHKPATSTPVHMAFVTHHPHLAVERCACVRQAQDARRIAPAATTARRMQLVRSGPHSLCDGFKRSAGTSTSISTDTSISTSINGLQLTKTPMLAEAEADLAGTAAAWEGWAP